MKSVKAKTKSNGVKLPDIEVKPYRRKKGKFNNLSLIFDLDTSYN